MRKRWLAGAMALGGVLGLAGTAGAQDTGYWMLDAGGGVYDFGGAEHYGERNAPSIDIEATPSGKGYFVLQPNGTVWEFGDAAVLSDPPAPAPGDSWTTLTATRSGRGFWVFSGRGCVAAIGDARDLGDMCDVALNAPVVGSAVTTTGNGYYMVASDGGIFTFGDAAFHGSTGGMRLNQPVNGMATDPDGRGYWLVAADGGIFSFEAPFYGSMGGTPLNQPVVGIVTSPTGGGYLMVARDGGIFTFGDVPFHGSLGGNPPAAGVVSVTPLPFRGGSPPPPPPPEPNRPPSKAPKPPTQPEKPAGPVKPPPPEPPVDEAKPLRPHPQLMGVERLAPQALTFNMWGNAWTEYRLTIDMTDAEVTDVLVRFRLPNDRVGRTISVWEESEIGETFFTSPYLTFGVDPAGAYSIDRITVVGPHGSTEYHYGGEVVRKPKAGVRLAVPGEHSFNFRELGFNLSVPDPSSCHPAYAGCVPFLIGDVLDCDDITPAQRTDGVVRLIVGDYGYYNDPFDLEDDDNRDPYKSDGVACDDAVLLPPVTPPPPVDPPVTPPPPPVDPEPPVTPPVDPVDPVDPPPVDPPPVDPPVEPHPELVDYVSFDGTTMERRTYVGEHVALLLHPSREHDLSGLIAGLDAAYRSYRNITGADPDPFFVMDGRLSIAEVPATCGAGCGFLGATGIELTQRTTDWLVDGYLDDGEFDQVVFYELGRNFWLYGAQLAPVDAFVTGFAIANRFVSMEEAGLAGAPFNNGSMPLSELRQSILVDLLDRYLASEHTWEVLLADPAKPFPVANPNNWHRNDLAAAFIHKIRVDHGATKYQMFWQAMRTAPEATTPREAVERFAQVAEAVTGTDYRTTLFRDATLG